VSKKERETRKRKPGRILKGFNRGNIASQAMGARSARPKRAGTITQPAIAVKSTGRQADRSRVFRGLKTRKHQPLIALKKGKGT